MSAMDENLLNYNSKADCIIEEIKEKIKNLSRILEEPEYKYHEHCDFLRHQVDIITSNAVNEINLCKQNFMIEINNYELKCKAIAEQENLKKLYIQELINKSNEELQRWKLYMQNADNVEKNMATICFDNNNNDNNADNSNNE